MIGWILWFSEFYYIPLGTIWIHGEVVAKEKKAMYINQTAIGHAKAPQDKWIPFHPTVFDWLCAITGRIHLWTKSVTTKKNHNYNNKNPWFYPENGSYYILWFICQGKIWYTILISLQVIAPHPPSNPISRDFLFLNWMWIIEWISLNIKRTKKHFLLILRWKIHEHFHFHFQFVFYFSECSRISGCSAFIHITFSFYFPLDFPMVWSSTIDGNYNGTMESLYQERHQLSSVHQNTIEFSLRFVAEIVCIKY